MKGTTGPSILLVDNDAPARQLSLSSGNYFLIEAATAAWGLAHAETFRPAVILTDLNLPDMDGIDFVRKIRRKQASIVVLVSARSSPDFVIQALDTGADDFISKPFSTDELGARVRVALRRAAISRPHVWGRTFRAGEFEVDFRRRKVRVSGRDVHLTPLEYRILSLLIENADHVLTYNRLLRKIWKSPKRCHLQHVRVHVAHLRRKLESDPAKPSHLVTEPGAGYQFQSRG